MQHDYEVTFPDFKNATNFCRWIGCGAVSRHSTETGFVWRSDGTSLEYGQKSKYEAYMGVDSVWRDDVSGLTWLYHSAYESLLTISRTRSTKPEMLFAGFSDWRRPTLIELKTLRSPLQDKNGLWRTPALAGKTGPVLRSATTSRFDRHVSRDWDFKRDCACEDKHRDSEIVWGSEGEYAGQEGGKSELTGAVSIYVRGTDSAQRPAWLRAQMQWSEEHHVDDFPVTEQSIGMLTKLRVYLDNLPPHLDRLKGLRYLDVSNTSRLFGLPVKRQGTSASHRAGCFPSEVCDLELLEKLSVIGAIEVIPETICDLGNLKELDLGWGFTALPTSLGRLSELRALRVTSNRLNSLPPSIGKLSALTELSVSADELRCLPEEIGLLRSLVRLSIHGCSFQKLPKQLGKLAQLVELDLSFTPLSELPSELSALKKLKLLDLCGAPITAVPVAVRELTNLERLILDGTQIEEIPDWLWEMKSLRYLSIAHAWRLPRLTKQDHPNIKVNDYQSRFDQPWAREWLEKMGRPN